MKLAFDEIELPYRAKVVAGPNSTSTNRFTYRYFLTFEEAARCKGRKGIPEYVPGNGKSIKRPIWLIWAQIAATLKAVKPPLSIDYNIALDQWNDTVKAFGENLPSDERDGFYAGCNADPGNWRI